MLCYAGKSQGCTQVCDTAGADAAGGETTSPSLPPQCECPLGVGEGLEALFVNTVPGTTVLLEGEGWGYWGQLLAQG